MKPVRLQLSRARGSNLQARSVELNGLPAVNVGRPSRWGNPFTIAAALESGYATTDDAARLFVVGCFRDWLKGSPYDPTWWQGPDSVAARTAIVDGLAELRGKNLACWCKPGVPCHADVLLELANP